jgi:arabinose-5-phosphate isomerase
MSFDPIANARSILRLESEAINRAANRIDGQFSRAVERVGALTGTLIASGVGKSGHVARKVAATFSSIGTPAIFLHPTEAAHGDIGVCRPGDVALLISKSGATAELCALLSLLRDRSADIIAIVGSLASPLAAASDIAIDASVCIEADEHNVAPSCSTTVAMALGDALAFTVMQRRRLPAAELARNHPGGSIGKLFQTAVAEVMARGSGVAWVRSGDLLSHVLQEVTRSGLGCACVVTTDGVLEGLITDGDIRRALQKGLDVASPAEQLMTRNPVTVRPDTTLYQALQAMEGRASQISVLPVIEGSRCVGVIRLHDIHQAAIL